MLKIGIATPCYRGLWSIETSGAIRNAEVALSEQGIGISSCQAAGSDVTHVRNHLFDIMKNKQVDAILWVDADVSFGVDVPKKLIDSRLPYVSARVPIRKNGRTIWAHGELIGNGRYRKTKTVGMGCLLMTKQVWNTVPDLSFYSQLDCGEDQSVLRQWTSTGGQVFIDMEAICNHDNIELPDRNDPSLHI